jgi:hypothetical protein
LRLAATAVVAPTLFGTGGYFYANRIEPGWVEVVGRELTLPALDPAFDGFRLAQISDLHMDGETMTEARLGEVVAMINAQEVDAVAITGDYVTSRVTPAILAGLTNALRELTAPTVAVLGNHDHWTNPSAIRRAIRDAGVIEVNNAVHTLRRDTAMLHLAGVDDIWERKHRLDAVLHALPAGGAAILLAHEPDYADTSAATGRFALQLSGHSHGGQVHLPLLGMPVLPALGQKYPSGLYHVPVPTGATMVQYTNRGLGMVRPFVRFNCRPEITVFTLRS